MKFLLSTILTLLALTAVTCHGGGPGPGPGPGEQGGLEQPPRLEDKRRKIQPLDIKPDRVTFESRFENETIKYRNEFMFRTSGFPAVGVVFMAKINDTRANGFALRVGVLRIVEVNAAANWTVRNSTNFIQFPGSNSSYLWSPIQIDDVPNNDNVTVKRIWSTYSNTTNGTNVKVTLEAFLVNAPENTGPAPLRPNAIKYGLIIENFPFTYSNSTLAIVKGLSCRADLKNNLSSANRSFAIEGGLGRFNWTSQVNYTLNGVNNTATITPDDTLVDMPTDIGMNGPVNDDDKVDQEKLVIMTFQTNSTGNSSLIYWDPQLSVDESSLGSNSTTNITTTSQKSSAGVTTTSFGLSLIVLLVSALVNI